MKSTWSIYFVEFETLLYIPQKSELTSVAYKIETIYQ